MALHVLPKGEDTEHDTSYACPCAPSRGTIEHEGSLRWAVLHQTLSKHLTAEPKTSPNLSTTSNQTPKSHST